jgi:peroxiredoxin
MEKADSNTITGGELNSNYAQFLQTANSLFDKRRLEIYSIRETLSINDEFESIEYKKVLLQLRATKSDDYASRIPIHQKMDEMEKTHTRYTEKAKLLFVDPFDSLKNAEVQWKYDFIKNNVSLMSYYLIWTDVVRELKKHPLTANLITEVFPLFERKYPNHIYTKKIGAELAGLQTIKPGNKFIDFKAPSIEGDTIQLSKIINNHVALIDLWGSWCAPCIAKSRLVVPLYHQYKDKGFVVVGIAREFKNTDAVKKRLSKEQFSWLNLIELDDRLNIWNTYGISNGAGLMLLVDKDGTILAIDPKPEELEKILHEKLN